MGQYADNVNFLAMEYTGLRPGISLGGQMCPSCNGGSSREHSLSVTRGEDGALLFKCHRASCKFKGIIPVGPRDEVPAHSAPIQKAPIERVITTEPLPDEIKALLNAKYKLVEPTLKHWGLAWTSDYGGRVILPIKSYSLDNDGMVLRSHSVPVGKPKTITKTTKPHVMAWFLHLPAWLEDASPEPLVLVEDIYSALRLWQAGISAVALLGTHLNEERVNEIAKVARQYPHLRVKLVLDYDAFGLACEYVRDYRHLIKMEVIKITTDVKDMTDEQLQEFEELTRKWLR